MTLVDPSTYPVEIPLFDLKPVVLENLENLFYTHISRDSSSLGIGNIKAYLQSTYPVEILPL